MKHKIKKLLSLLMVMTVVVSMNMTAFAADATTYTEAIGFYEVNDVIYECVLTPDDITHGYMSPDEDNIEMIVEWTAEDGYVYLGYFFCNPKKLTSDYYFCILYDNNRKETKTSLQYKNLVDSLDGATVADLSFTATKDPEVVKMTWGDRSENWYSLDAENTIDLLASIEDFIITISEN